MDNFQKNQYFELLKKDQKMIEEGSSLYQENIREYGELISYGALLWSQVLYSQRNDYISLIEKYLTKEIDAFSLKYKFFELQRIGRKITNNIQKDFEKLSKISIDPKSDEFSNMIERMFGECENFESESDERQFRAFFEKIFLEMKNY